MLLMICVVLGLCIIESLVIVIASYSLKLQIVKAGKTGDSIIKNR